MIRVWSYINGEDITDRGLSFREDPIRAGNLTPRGLYYHVHLSDKTPVVHPYSISRWHNEGKYTESMLLADAWNHTMRNPIKIKTDWKAAPIHGTFNTPRHRCANKVRECPAPLPQYNIGHLPPNTVFGICRNKGCNNEVAVGTGSEMCEVCVLRLRYELIMAEKVDKDGWFIYFFRVVGSEDYGIRIRCVYPLTEDKCWQVFINNQLHRAGNSTWGVDIK